MNLSNDAIALEPVSSQSRDDKHKLLNSARYGNSTVDDEPSEEELHTLCRVSGQIPFKVYTIALLELCERFSYSGTIVCCKSSGPVNDVAVMLMHG